MGVGETACSAMLSLDDVTECRKHCSELSSAELDLVILGIIHSSLNCNETSISRRVGKNRQSTRIRVRTGPGKPGKSWNFILAFSRTGKSWKKAAGPGKFWKSVKLN